jgi:serine/threonine protein kinase
MGQVYLARSTGLGGFERQVVVKTLDLSITDDDDAFVTMFLDEARLVGALHHQYIAPVYEVGCDDDGCYYLVMDYVHGETAEAVYRASADRSWPVPLDFALTVVSCIASALDYAHNVCSDDGTPLDIVHRDISLSNVMVGYDGAVKLIDFGIAKAANRATKTQVGTLKGKIGYLAPEQILRKPADHRADLFSLGIVLYELTTATRAFRESSDLVTLERITSGELKRPTDVAASYPAELERIVLKALQVDPEDRYQDAAEMGRELERLAARMGLPLGHGAIKDVMTSLFGEQRRSRRRMARGSSPKGPKTDTVRDTPSDDDDEKTPVIDLSPAPVIEEPEHKRKTRERSLKPTTPFAKRGDADRSGAREIVLEDAPTPISDPVMKAHAHHALIPLEDRPTPLSAQRSFSDGDLPLVPTPPPSRLDSPDIVKSARVLTPIPGATARMNTPPGLVIPVLDSATTRAMPPPPPLAARGTPSPPRRVDATPPPVLDDDELDAIKGGRRLPTGPQLPQHAFRFPPPLHPSEASTDILDYPSDHVHLETPTEISPTTADREDPTDVSSPALETRPQPRLRGRTATAEIVRRSRWSPSTITNAVVQRIRLTSSASASTSSTRTWLWLCLLFAIAVAVAVAIVLL